MLVLVDDVKIWIVKEYEAIEGGGRFESIVGVWFDKTLADQQAAACNDGKYTSQDVSGYEVNDPENAANGGGEGREV